MKIDLTNNELIGFADKEIQELCRTGGKSFKMSVPVDCKDTDVILSELLNRFEKILESKYLEQINNIMWESLMIKGKSFGEKEGLKIMEVLEKWSAEK
jgi:hypothetical protein